MAKINQNYNKLPLGYLFSEITKRAKAFQMNNPGVEIMNLGIGNTTQALPSSIIRGLKLGVDKLSSKSTYTGYGDEQGDKRLRQALSDWYKKRDISLAPGEIFISDGAKPDTANIQSIFDVNSTVAVQDPVYPVYVDSNIIAGKKEIHYLACEEKNGFIPSPPAKKVDLIYICSPNNPTGAVATKAQLKKFVDYAIEFKSIIIFDAAYSEFIQDSKFPKSIYELQGASKCAIEINSFSKSAGFTGVRLGWTVVPIDLVCENSVNGKLNKLWNRRQTTMFNGASNIAQEGGLAVLSLEGQRECRKIIQYYMDNAKIIKQELELLGISVFGGVNSPYLWIKTPGNLSSWEFFDKLLSEAHVVGIPGSGFGPHGEGYFRLSAFGHKEDMGKALKNIKKNLKI